MSALLTAWDSLSPHLYQWISMFSFLHLRRRRMHLQGQVLSGVLPISRISAVPFCVHQLARVLPLEQIVQLTHSSPTSSTSNAIATVASTSGRSKSTSKARSNSNPHPLIHLWSRASMPGDPDSASSNRQRISPGHQDGQRTTS